jgi:hypothetical protein
MPKAQATNSSATKSSMTSTVSGKANPARGFIGQA